MIRSTLQQLALLALIAITSAFPAPSTLSSRDNGACHPQNMLVDVSDYNCPKKNTLDKNGHCSKQIPNVPGKAGCAAYCEVRLTKLYGQEVPYSNSQCMGGTSCSISKAQSVTYTNTVTIAVGTNGKILEAAFNLGATYSYSEALTFEDQQEHSQDLGQNECGYWTFVPFTIESCGDLTESAIKSAPVGFGGGTYDYCDKDRLFDTHNWCITTPYKTSNGRADGTVLFVWTDCKTGGVLWDKMAATPAYLFPGVSTAQT